MTVEVFSDVVCPFCYIGKRHLETALAELGLANAEVRYRSFELDPHLADSDLGSPSTLHLAAKKGLSVADAERMTQAVAYRAIQVGIPMDFTKAKVLRTRDAHRLLQWARTQSLEQAMNLKEELMNDYFCGGVNLNEPDPLVDAAERAGSIAAPPSVCWVTLKRFVPKSRPTSPTHSGSTCAAFRFLYSTSAWA